MKSEFSPEEKLLRLIKGAKKKVMPKEEAAPKIGPPESIPKLGKMPAPAPEAKPKRAKSISISLPFKLKGINTRTLNSIFIVMLVCLLVYFIYDLFYITYAKEGEPEIVMEVEKKISKVEKEDALLIKPYSFYSSSIGDRNIFTPLQVETEAVATGPTLEEIMSNFSLIGIIAGDRPQAIIEDKKSGKSHFLYEGSTVGQVKIVEILDDSVVMEYQGQKFELVL